MYVVIGHRTHIDKSDYFAEVFISCQNIRIIMLLLLSESIKLDKWRRAGQGARKFSDLKALFINCRSATKRF